MIPTVTSDHIRMLLSAHLNEPVTSCIFTPVGGGNISRSFRISINDLHFFFCKIHPAASPPRLFEKEKNGLLLLRQQQQIKVPDVIVCTNIQDDQVLILEWIASKPATKKSWQIFGEQLAGLHHQSALQYGLGEDNYIGALPQSNRQWDRWIDFFIHERLEPQIQCAVNNGLLGRQYIQSFSRYLKNLETVFEETGPSLVHGDLWSGNFIITEQDQPVLFDPAVYFGHRCMDLAMARLFGGFDEDFYASYAYHYPLPQNYREQWDACNCYPELVHLNLFGSSYLPGILRRLSPFKG